MSHDTQALAQRLVAYLETGHAAPGLFTNDVFCDFSAPRWRLLFASADSIRAMSGLRPSGIALFCDKALTRAKIGNRQRFVEFLPRYF